LRRIAVVGSSGAGKTTLSLALSHNLQVPHLELDGLFHQPGWTELDLADFRDRVTDFAASDSWVIDGNYERTRDLVLERADTVVWLRMRRSLVLYQVLRRTFRRLLHREELWNGNRESLRSVLSVQPERSIVVWAWRKHGKYDEHYTELMRAAPVHQHWVVLRNRREVQALLKG
jgi:adenylate kinase family enzyme